jgi:hypothetical protein
MTRPPGRDHPGAAPYTIPDPAPPGEAPRVAPGPPHELLAGHCRRCGAVGTHYLTCPDLRLPSGYRLSEAPGPKCRCGLPADSCGVCG